MSTFYFNDVAVSAEQFEKINDAFANDNGDLAYEILDEARAAAAPARMAKIVEQLMPAAKPATVAAPKAKVKAAKGAKTGTKQEAAVEIYKRLSGDKAAVIAAIMSELGMSTAGATTYFYNAKKLA